MGSPNKRRQRLFTVLLMKKALPRKETDTPTRGHSSSVEQRRTVSSDKREKGQLCTTVSFQEEKGATVSIELGETGQISEPRKGRKETDKCFRRRGHISVPLETPKGTTVSF